MKGTTTRKDHVLAFIVSLTLGVFIVSQMPDLSFYDKNTNVYFE
jgi:hypothetical protein